MVLLEVGNLVKLYPGTTSIFGPAGAGRRALDGVSFVIHAGETLGLVGESGCGKTSVARILLRLIEPTSGSVRFDGHDLLAASGRHLRSLRAAMQVVFQDPFASLDPRMRVEQIITEPLIVHGVGRGKAERHGRALELLKQVGLEESALGRYPHEFSGGQRQRIAIARALALTPRFLVLDEPVSALDVSVAAQVVNLLAKLQRQLGLTYLFISHAMPIVRYLSHRIAVMSRGKIVEVGDTAQITSQPSHPYTQMLLAATPEVELATI